MFSLGFWTFVEREVKRFIRVWSQTLVPPFVMALLYLVVFGVFLSGRIQSESGYDFIEFVFPGLVLMSCLTNTFQATAHSLFISRWEGFIDDLLVSPLTYGQMVWGFLLAASLRGLFTATLVVLAGLVFTGVGVSSWAELILAILVSNLVFASAGLLVGLWARRWDNMLVFQTYLITPLVFLGGVFYARDTLDPSLQWILAINPIFYMVNAVRHAILGISDVSYGMGLAVSAALAIGFTLTVQWLFRRGYNLRR